MRGGCGATSVRSGAAPDWIGLAGAPGSLPYAVASPPTAAADIFGYPLRAGHPENRRNKILWVVHDPVAGQLTVVAHLADQPTPTFTWTWPAAGQTFPSIEDVPSPGCWHFDLAIGERHWSIDLDYDAAEK